MCDSASQVLIDDVVDEKINAQEMFTAFDISLEVRRRGGTERHREMKGYIHDVMKDKVQNGDYNTTSISIPNGNPPYAILYYHAFSDPSTYKPLNRQAPQNQPQPAVQPALQASPQQADYNYTAVTNDSQDGDDTSAVDGLVSVGKFHLDSRDRLLVPTKFLRDAGFSAGDKVFVFGGDDHVCLINNDLSANGKDNLTVKMVERNGDVRIAASTLKRPKMDGNSFVITNEADGVYIRAS